MQKNAMAGLIFVGVLAGSSVSQAFAVLLAVCTTDGGQYEVSVASWSGTGLIRQPRLAATIWRPSGDEIVASVQVDWMPVTNSAGVPEYRDTASGGGAFSLKATPGGEPVYRLRADIRESDGSQSRIDSPVSCSQFGAPLRRTEVK